MAHEPEPGTPQQHNTDIGWRVVLASMVLPLAWVVTGSVTLTIIVAGFGCLILAQSNPAIAQISQESLPLRFVNFLAPIIVLAIFVMALIRNMLLLR